MGPRLDRRGNRLRRERRLKTALLQWGHAWIGVGIGRHGAGPRPTVGFNGATPG